MKRRLFILFPFLALVAAAVARIKPQRSFSLGGVIRQFEDPNIKELVIATQDRLNEFAASIEHLPWEQTGLDRKKFGDRIRTANAIRVTRNGSGLNYDYL